MSEIEDLRAQLMEANSLYEASRRREARTRHDSSLMDASTILDDAKRELYKVHRLYHRKFSSLNRKRNKHSTKHMSHP